MKNPLYSAATTLALLLLLLAPGARLLAASDGFRSLFNGRDLTGWDGNPALWSVQDGVIVGVMPGPETLTYNQFLIWRGGTVKDFELRAMVKQSGNNSGIQYRSREMPNIGRWSVGGYQCDIHPVTANNAMVYDEQGRGIVVQNGQTVITDPDGARWLTAERKPVEVDVSQWNEYTIVAQGNRLVHKINGQVTIELVDHDEKARSLEGLLAFQIHRGPAMRVEIKDIRLKTLPATPVTAFHRSQIPASAKKIERPAPGQKKGGAGKAGKAAANAPAPGSAAKSSGFMANAAAPDTPTFPRRPTAVGP